MRGRQTDIGAPGRGQHRQSESWLDRGPAAKTAGRKRCQGSRQDHPYGKWNTARGSAQFPWGSAGRSSSGARTGAGGVETGPASSSRSQAGRTTERSAVILALETKFLLFAVGQEQDKCPVVVTGTSLFTAGVFGCAQPNGSAASNLAGSAPALRGPHLDRRLP